jgi:hypothetical protein
MGIRFLLILSAAFLCSAECVQVGPLQFGRVNVSAFSVLGERLPNLSIDLIEAGTGKSFKAQFRGAVAENIPYGTYRLRVWSPGFRSFERELRLYQPEVSLRTQLSVSVECQGLAEIAGVVQPAPKHRELWVKLVPLRGIGGVEVHVSRDGWFLASGLDDGEYLLLVVDGNAIVHTESVDVPRSTRVTVDLARN